MRVIAYLAASLDGYIADVNGGVDWLNALPNPEQSDYGFAEFMDSVDALLMGSNTFKVVQGFGMWPYTKPVYVASNSIKMVPSGYENKIELVQGDIATLIEQLSARGLKRLYIDGGALIKAAMAQGLLNELILTQVPLILGQGISLFAPSEQRVELELKSSEVLGLGLVKSHYLLNYKTP